MVRFGCVAFSVAIVQAYELPPPEALASIGEGLVEGFISDNDDVIQCVTRGVEPVAEHAGTAGKQFIDALKNHNVGELVEVAKNLGETCEGLEPMWSACDPGHTDVMGILAILKDIHGPVDLIKHMGDDLKNDMDDIFDEAGAAFKAYLEKDWDMFGKHLGMFLHRLVVGKFPDGESRRLQDDGLPPLPPAKDVIAFAVPFVSSILNDKPDLIFCALGALPVVTGLENFAKDFKEAITHFNKTALTQSVKDIAGVCTAGSSGIKEACQPVADDVNEIARVMKTIHNVAGLIDHMFGNIKDNVDNIEDDLDKSFKAFRAHPRDYATFGDRLGKAVHRILIERYPDDVVAALEASEDVIV